MRVCSFFLAFIQRHSNWQLFFIVITAFGILWYRWNVMALTSCEVSGDLISLYFLNLIFTLSTVGQKSLILVWDTVLWFSEIFPLNVCLKHNANRERVIAYKPNPFILIIKPHFKPGLKMNMLFIMLNYSLHKTKYSNPINGTILSFNMQFYNIYSHFYAKF
jgi:hypothetical protein